MPISLAVLCCIIIAGTCSAQLPQAGVYFDCGENQWDNEYRVYKSFLSFDAYLILNNTGLPLTGIEYSLGTPDDPGNTQIILMAIEHSGNYSLEIGHPWSGHSITFWPPFDISEEHFVLCKYSFLSVDNCNAGMDGNYPVIVSPHQDSGYLRGTYYPDHELFDITGLTSYLCSEHWPPMLTEVQAFTPKAIYAWFDQTLYRWENSYDDMCRLYTTSEPHDTIEVLHALKAPPL